MKVEAGPEPTDREITCQVCDGPLVGREGKFRAEVFLFATGHCISPTGLSERFQKSGQVRSLFVAQLNSDRGGFAINTNV